MIYKTIKIPIKCSKSDYQYLRTLNKLSAEVWNKVLDMEKEFRERNNGKWIQRNELQKLTKKIVNLHSKGIHFVVHKYLFARDSALQAKKGNGENNKFPHRKKKFFTTGWDYQSIKCDYEKGVLYLAKPMTYSVAKGKKVKQKPFKCYVKNLPINIVQVELIFKEKYYLSIKYKEESNYLQVNSNNHASIDLGEIHAITSIDSSGNAIIITGRKMRAIKQLRNKHQAKIYSRLSKCKKGSRQYWKYRKAMRRLSTKSENQILDCVHKISKLFLDYCILNNISIVYYGDLDSATRGTKQKRSVGGKLRQKLSQWNYGQVVDSLSNKLSRYGIKMIKVKEYYTSSKCPSCKTINKPAKRNYECQCGYKQHRDIVGAINILKDNSGSKLVKYKIKKYLQIT